MMSPYESVDPLFSNMELKEKLDFEKRITEEIIRLKEHLLDVRRKLADAYISGSPDTQARLEGEIENTLKNLKEVELMKQQNDESSFIKYLYDLSLWYDYSIYIGQHGIVHPSISQSHDTIERERKLSSELRRRLEELLIEHQKQHSQKMLMERDLQQLHLQMQQERSAHREEMDNLKADMNAQIMQLQQSNRQLQELQSNLEALQNENYLLREKESKLDEVEKQLHVAWQVNREMEEEKANLVHEVNTLRQTLYP